MVSILIIINYIDNPTSFTSREDVINFCSEIKKAAYKEEYEILSDMYLDFLLECFDADVRLQKMVFDRFGEDYLCLVILPVNNFEDLQSYSFELLIRNDKKVRKRDEKIFQEFCDICFKNIKPFYNRLFDFYGEP